MERERHTVPAPRPSSHAAPHTTNTQADGDVYLYGVEKAMVHVSPRQGVASYSAATFDPGSTALYYLTNDGGEFTRVVVSPSEQRMALYVSSDTSPSNLYVHDFASGRTTRLTDTLSRQIDPDDLVEAEVVRFDSFDGMKLPNVLFRPHQASATAKAPALVWVHGGPGGQTRKGYSAFIQYLVNHGYVVLGINNRGSSGYGKTFFTADDGKHGREPLWDCVAAKKYLQSLPYVDAERIGIIGGSYGGYMTLAALAFQPREFKVGVDIFGVSNWQRTLESIPRR